MGKYISTKTYGHERGYAVAYRQWRADSHCRLIHGYSLSFYLEFESDQVDVRNWVVDFGSLKTFKDFLEDHFDHTLLVSQDDPEFKTFEQLHEKKLCKMVVVEKTGCEGLSRFLYDYVNEIWLPENGYNNVHCNYVKIAETPANSGWFYENSTDYEKRKAIEILSEDIISVVGNDFPEAVKTVAELIYNQPAVSVTKEYVSALYKTELSRLSTKFSSADRLSMLRKGIRT